MTDYVQTTDLETLVADLHVGVDDTLTTAQAESLISIIEGEMNGVLASLGVVVPVTLVDSPYSYKFVRALVVQGVIGLVQSAIHALSDDTEGSRESAFWRRYEQGTRRLIENGGAQLFDAVVRGDESERNLVPTLSNQMDNVDRYLTLRDLSFLRHRDNDIAAIRLRPIRSRTRYFTGGIQ